MTVGYDQRSPRQAQRAVVEALQQRRDLQCRRAASRFPRRRMRTLAQQVVSLYLGGECFSPASREGSNEGTVSAFRRRRSCGGAPVMATNASPRSSSSMRAFRTTEQRRVATRVRSPSPVPRRADSRDAARFQARGCGGRAGPQARRVMLLPWSRSRGGEQQRIPRIGRYRRSDEFRNHDRARPDGAGTNRPYKAGRP